MSVFISYSHEDSDWTHQFAEALKNLDVEVWLDAWRINPGDSITTAIEDGMRASDAIVAILSPKNVDRPNLMFELGLAMGTGKRLIPVVSDEVEGSMIPFDLRTRRWLAQRSPDETAREVAAALKAQDENATSKG